MIFPIKHFFFFFFFFFFFYFIMYFVQFGVATLNSSNTPRSAKATAVFKAVAAQRRKSASGLSFSMISRPHQG